jgi:hypothetical protein
MHHFLLGRRKWFCVQFEQKKRDLETKVCVEDPPRYGMQKSAVRAIRDCPLLRRLVYVACAPKALVRDAQRALLSDGEWTMWQFVRTVWFGIDQFPQTDKCHSVLLMERYNFLFEKLLIVNDRKVTPTRSQNIFMIETHQISHQN